MQNPNDAGPPASTSAAPAADRPAEARPRATARRKRAKHLSDHGRDEIRNAVRTHGLARVADLLGLSRDALCSVVADREREGTELLTASRLHRLAELLGPRTAALLPTRAALRGPVVHETRRVPAFQVEGRVPPRAPGGSRGS